MPLFSTSIQNQQQAGQSSQRFYPDIPVLRDDWSYGDDFARTSVTPTNAYTLYTSAAQTTGTASIVSLREYRIVTAGTLNDYMGSRTTGMFFKRAFGLANNASWSGSDTRSQIEIDVIFGYANKTATLQTFAGLWTSDSAMTALPTTAQHIGLYRNTAVSNNFVLSSGNGTAQATTDTGIAPSVGTSYRLNIIWSSNTSGTLRLYSGTALNTLESTHAFTSFASATDPGAFPLHFWANTLAASVGDVVIFGWMVKAT